MTEDLLKTFIHFLIAKAALRIPLLAMPVFNPIFVWIFTKVAVFFYAQLSVFVSFKVIDINIYRELVSYGKIVDEIKKETDKTKIPELRLKYNEKLEHLISFNSSFVWNGSN